jgi:hypothetical protein
VITEKKGLDALHAHERTAALPVHPLEVFYLFPLLVVVANPDVLDHEEEGVLLSDDSKFFRFLPLISRKGHLEEDFDNLSIFESIHPVRPPLHLHLFEKLKETKPIHLLEEISGIVESRSSHTNETPV